VAAEPTTSSQHGVGSCERGGGGVVDDKVSELDVRVRGPAPARSDSRAPGRARGHHAATLAFAFTLRHPQTAGNLIGATAPRQLDESIAAVALAGRLTDTDLGDLRALSAGAARSEPGER
jgi:aryl-alcohol dehydrogenase-like predicted oxidoreductase